MSQKKITLSSVTIRELTTKSHWHALYPLITQLNKELSRKQFDALLSGMLESGYRCVGAWQGKNLIGACGFWVGYRFWCGKYLALDNVVVDQAIRSRGIGKKMVAYVEKEATKLKCDLVELDSYTTAYSAHRFYFREGYCILGYHFTKKLAK